MKWILASTTALALTMGIAQYSVAQEATQPEATPGTDQPATDTAPAGESNDTLMENQPVAPETGTEATDVAPATDPEAAVTMDAMPMPADTDLSARNVVGAEVIGPDGSSVGVVDDLVLDASGKIEQVIIADGAILGLGGKNVAISYSGATVASDAEGDEPVVRVNMTEEALDGAAEFDKSQLEEQGDRLASSYIERDVKLVSTDASDDATGEINDLLLDQSGTVKYAIIEFGGVMDMGDSQVAVGFDKISGAPEGEPMSLSMTEAELQSAPKLDAVPAAAD
jgi:sporulation protein YlmC with PRC-barrel domain